MSLILRRSLSTIIPPKVASPKAIGAAPDALRMERVVSFYEKLPRGPAPATEATNFFSRYRAKHLGDNPTAKPFIHALLIVMAVSYAQAYYYHLRHHKNNAH